MQGWSPDFIPKLTSDAVDMGLIDLILTVSGADAKMKRLERVGLLNQSTAE